jgi:hypothetical protein
MWRYREVIVSPAEIGAPPLAEPTEVLLDYWECDDRHRENA